MADVELDAKPRNSAAVFEVATGSKDHASTAIIVDNRVKGMVSNNCIFDLVTLINPESIKQFQDSLRLKVVLLFFSL